MRDSQDQKPFISLVPEEIHEGKIPLKPMNNVDDPKGRRTRCASAIAALLVLIIVVVVVSVVVGTRNNGGRGGGSSSSHGSFDCGEATSEAISSPTPVPSVTGLLSPTANPENQTVSAEEPMHPGVQPTKLPTKAPTRQLTYRPTDFDEKQSFCCFYSPSGDFCGDCGEGAFDSTGFCSKSLENCNECTGGVYCAGGALVEPTQSPTPRPTVQPTVQPGNPTLPPAPRPTLEPTHERPIQQRNVFAQANAFYVNPTFAANLDRTIATTTNPTVARNLEIMKDVPSAYWIDVKSKIMGNSTSDLRGILLDAAKQSPAPLCVFMVYNLPNRDCAALASRGEICCAYFGDGTCDYENSGDCADGLEEYKATYVDPYVQVLKEFDGVVPVAVVIEPDSLPNFATNFDNPNCNNRGTQNAYTVGIKYAVEQIALHTDDVAIYLDAAHGGWLGWESNLANFVDTVSGLNVEAYIRGFATNVANYNGLGVPCDLNVVDCRTDTDSQRNNPCCEDPCELLPQFNRANNEHNYAQLLVDAFSEALPGFEPHVIIDTGRNGNPGTRTDCSTWCNARDALVGEWPTSDTLQTDVVDAYFWLKTPGESDGCTELLPSNDDEFLANGTCPRYDRSCAAFDSIGTQAGEPYAPEAGHWFEFQVRMLAEELPGSAGVGSPTRAPTTPRPTADKPTAPPVGTTPVSIFGQLTTSGNRVVAGNGDVVQLIGMSLFWSNSAWEGAPFYNHGVIDTLVDDWQCTLVRAAMGVDENTGYIHDPEGNENRVRIVVEAAIARGIYVIIDWHSHHAEDYLEEAKEFFQRMATDYGAYPNVIFEVYNEYVSVILN